MTWAADITKGVHDTLQVEKNNFILHIENMDTKRHNSQKYYASLANLYKNKYSHIKFDLILASDNNAFDFLKKYRNDIFGQVPVSFSGLNDYNDFMIKGVKNYTGIAEISSEKETVELILKLHPKTKNIYIINDYLKTGRALQKTLEQNLKSFKNKVNLIYNKNQTLRQLQNIIKKLPDDTILLMGIYFADKNNQYFTYEKVGSYLLDISPVPVYTLTNFTISHGVIGGKVLSGYQHGSMMAKLGMSILQGIDPNKIAVVKEGVNQFIFNKKALKKFNINTNLLPKNHTVINQDKQIIKKYGLTISTIMIILTCILVAILYFFYKKDTTNEEPILKLLVYGPIVFIPTVIAILTYSIITNNQEIHIQDLEKLKATYIKEQKSFTINRVEEVSQYIHSLANKKDALAHINNYRYGETGYIFALNIQGDLLGHGTLPFIIGKNMLDLEDVNGVKLTKKIIHNAITNSLELVQYMWLNPKTNQNEVKYTYAKYIPKYDMIIASGVYTRDINTIVKERSQNLNNKNDIHIRNILTISIIVIILSTIVSVILSNLIKKIFKRYNHLIDNKNKNLKELNNSLEHKIKEEVQISHEKDSVIFEQSKLASMGNMIGNIAHQWRQPLSVISTASTGMIVKTQYNMLNDDELIKNCELINQNAQYLSQTIEDFKNYIKNDRVLVKFNLENNIQNLLSLVSASLQTHQINIILNLDKNIVLNGYPNELIQCMMNIINNAKDALLNIKDTRYIFIQCKQVDDTVEIIFKDNAQGIPKNVITQIFEPYFTTKHKSQGTGLGLSMTYNIITQGMKGAIEVKNATFLYQDIKLTGAEFKITLPLN